MSAVLISINPLWCELIANGMKTVEVRKTAPREFFRDYFKDGQCEDYFKPFKCYIYCTVPKKSGDIFCVGGKNPRIGNGKVIGEFTCDNIECFTTDYRMDKEQTERISQQSYLSFDQLSDYEFNSHCLYAWHISDLKIYDKPKELSEFSHTNDSVAKLKKTLLNSECAIDDKKLKPIRKPPLSWCYVEEI